MSVEKQNAQLDRSIERRLAAQPRFSVTFYFDVAAQRSVPTSVWDRQQGVFHNADELVGNMVQGLFAACGGGS